MNENFGQERKKPSTTTLAVFFAAVLVVGMACLVMWSYREIIHGAEKSPSVSPTSPPLEFRNDDEGYSLILPGGWNIERSATSGVAAYPPSSSEPSCKISFSAFPAVAEEDRSSWIASMIRANLTHDVQEISAEGILVDGSPGVRWTGTIDGATSTLAYIFTAARAYEIVPVPCADGSDTLSEFLSGITFFPLNDFAAKRADEVVPAAPDVAPSGTSSSSAPPPEVPDDEEQDCM